MRLSALESRERDRSGQRGIRSFGKEYRAFDDTRNQFAAGHVSLRLVQIITRTGRKNYVLAKYAVIFLTSGFAAAVPLTLQMTAEYGIRWRYLDLELPGFVHNPVLSVLLYFIGEWILSGLMAGFGLMISMFCKHMAAAIGIPGLFCLLYRLANAGLFSHLASSGTGDGTALIFQGILLGEVLLLFAVTLPVCVYRGEHLDVLEEGSRADEN